MYPLFSIVDYCVFLAVNTETVTVRPAAAAVVFFFESLSHSNTFTTKTLKSVTLQGRSLVFGLGTTSWSRIVVVAMLASRG